MERGRNNRRGDMPRPCTYVGEDTTKNERVGIYGVFERQERDNDIPKMGEYEICLQKQRVLV